MDLDARVKLTPRQLQCLFFLLRRLKFTLLYLLTLRVVLGQNIEKVLFAGILWKGQGSEGSGGRRE